MYKRLSIIFFFILISILAHAQKWQPGHFTDIKGNVETGFIRPGGSGKGPIKNEGFIEFKEDNKTEPFKLSASDLKSFVMGKDSFVVAHAPGNETWARDELDFVKVVLDEDIKLYAAGGVKVSGGRGIGFAPEIGTGIGTGGYGGGIGGGISIPIGGGGGGSYEKLVYYYGENPAALKRLNNQNFEDVMCDMMGDEPDVVDKIHAKVYMLENIDRLIAYFKQVKAAHK
jgi:hypothetical protein